MTGLARGVLSLVQAADGSRDRSVADAMRAEPWFVAGTGREDTELMRAVPGLLVKGGADGVHVAAVPGRGAVALKLDDGAERGRTPALAPRSCGSASRPTCLHRGCRPRCREATEWSVRCGRPRSWPADLRILV